ncbi:MAG: GldG family protein [Saprospiraceae bacterium]|nr:GldG family protein [Candidatus Defluviibacterium haderslevense]
MIINHEFIRNKNSYRHYWICSYKFLAKQFFFRFDLTQNKEFTLSKATKDIIKNLDEKVNITAYFSNDLPTDVAKTQEELKDILNEFANISKGQVEYQFISPNDDPKKEEEAMKEGIQPVMINVREKEINQSNSKHFWVSPLN